ncbi:PilZ domain-containing protein [Methylobacterium sp. E-041]|uniref:PilZ domain-containing protein n=1 Tax=unclassified Methylobacterium TaxID=2615210 RepID=UPI001FBB8256|nr:MULTISPECIES: PilZ domain-containing protein [unclassified Methylobacterium]MCJ2042687.1 PilZ domain-containing protein [Methylobacterium sp. J-059]MCJ2108115.1 PilZ domain-containing protein [Methylobacterium sp. E-041]
MDEPDYPRQSPRRETMIIGAIRTDAGDEIPCVVRDVSKEGARISVSQKEPLTDCLELTLQGSQRSVRMCVVWRRGPFVGLSILGITTPVTGGASG